jgi:hypothetical protein
MSPLSTEVDVKWSAAPDVPMKHVNLTDTLQSVMRGIAQAARGEGVEIDPDTLPTDDDD